MIFEYFSHSILKFTRSNLFLNHTHLRPAWAVPRATSQCSSPNVEAPLGIGLNSLQERGHSRLSCLGMSRRAKPEHPRRPVRVLPKGRFELRVIVRQLRRRRRSWNRLAPHTAIASTACQLRTDDPVSTMNAGLNNAIQYKTRAISAPFLAEWHHRPSTGWLICRSDS